ncbi:MAG: hypothetical protein ACYC0M_12735 [Burkholderiales bacterium]
MEWMPPSFRVVDQPFHSDISMPEQVGASIPLIQNLSQNNPMEKRKHSSIAGG